MKIKFRRLIVLAVFLCFMISMVLQAQEIEPVQISYNQKTFQLYPQTLDKLPDIPSPLRTKEGLEIVLALMKDNTYALIPVTVENGAPLLYSRRIRSLYGKDRQLQVNPGDFPTLAKTGLHSEEELEGKDTITGIPVSVITYIGRPGRFSGAGFMAENEDIISVLKGDNRLVKTLSLTHPQTAKPLFHMWNIVLKEIELGKFGRFWDNIKHIFYNGRKVVLKAQGTKGWQVSIFQDEIQGRHDLIVHRELSPGEKVFLRDRYSQLSPKQMTEFEEKLSSLHFSEMAPYYIMRYGFYEGHTDYRSDPISIAFIFGLKSLEEIVDAFEGSLYTALTNHFIDEGNS